jgi:hypothetical protein
VGFEFGNSHPFQARIVIWVEIIDAQHPTTLLQQRVRDVHADEPCGACNENRLSQTTPLRGTAL